jgi:hypothetical protein
MPKLERTETVQARLNFASQRMLRFSKEGENMIGNRTKKARMDSAIGDFVTKTPITIRKLAYHANVTIMEMANHLKLHPEIEKAGYVSVGKGLTMRTRLYKRVEP